MTGALLGVALPLRLPTSRKDRAAEAAIVGALAGAFFAIGAGDEDFEIAWTLAVATAATVAYLVLVAAFTEARRRRSGGE